VLQNTHFFATECILAVQGRPRSSKVDKFGTNRKRMRLPVSRSLRLWSLHRFRDTATYWLKIGYFSYPSLIRRPRYLCSLWNFALKLTVRKLVMGISSSEDRMIVAGVVLAWYQRVTDRRSDGRTVCQTESIIANTASKNCSLRRHAVIHTAKAAKIIKVDITHQHIAHVSILNNITFLWFFLFIFVCVSHCMSPLYTYYV